MPARTRAESAFALADAAASCVKSMGRALSSVLPLHTRATNMYARRIPRHYRRHSPRAQNDNAASASSLRAPLPPRAPPASSLLVALGDAAYQARRPHSADSRGHPHSRLFRANNTLQTSLSFLAAPIRKCAQRTCVPLRGIARTHCARWTATSATQVRPLPPSATGRNGG